MRASIYRYKPNLEHENSKRNQAYAGKREHHGLAMGTITDRGPHQGQTMVATSPMPNLYSYSWISSILLHHGTSSVCLCWISLGPFSYILWSTSPRNLHSTLVTWLTKSKFANTLKISKIKHNNRNKGKNHTIKHTNAINDSQTLMKPYGNITFITPLCLNHFLSSSKQ